MTLQLGAYATTDWASIQKVLLGLVGAGKVQIETKERLRQPCCQGISDFFIVSLAKKMKSNLGRT